MSRRRDRPRGPRPAGGIVAAFAGGLQPLGPLADVQRVWAEAVGEAIAAQADPVAERGGVLTVACASAVWAQELELMGPELVERLNGALGAPRVTALRCRATAGRAGRG